MVRKDLEHERRLAKAMYRHLRDVVGPSGASAVEIAAALGWDAPDRGSPHDGRARVLMTLQWLRAHGVDVVCARRGDAESPSAWALRSLLPEAWDALL